LVTLIREPYSRSLKLLPPNTLISSSSPEVVLTKHLANGVLFLEYLISERYPIKCAYNITIGFKIQKE
jgi:hypothetical protein